MRLAVFIALTACSGPIAMTDAGTDAGPRPAFVAPELADEAALDEMGYATLPIFASDSMHQVSSEDRGVSSPDIVLLQNGNRDMNHFVCLGRENDVREPGLEEFLYDEPECRETYARGAVIARFEGSGVLVRLWATLFSIRSQRPDRERLLVWVDDDPDPVVDVPLEMALHGSDVFAPPFGAGASDRLAWYYPIVFASKLLVALDGLGPLDLVYHQTTIARSDVARARAMEPLARDAAISALTERPVSAEELREPVTIAAGETQVVLDLAGPSTIDALSVRAADPSALDGVELQIRWDGELDPSIAVPLRELFAAGLDPPEIAGNRALSAEQDASGWTMRLALPMPFAVSAEIALSSSRDTTLELIAERSPGVPAGAYGHLQVERRETIGPTAEASHPIALATGPGRLVGVCAMMEGGPLEGLGTLGGPLNFLEGDEHIVADGVELFGTGTEDYFDGAFYFASGPFATPFAAAWGARAIDDTHGRASACRWHVGPGAIDFESSLSVDLEIGPGVPTTLDRYRTIAFLYL